MGKPGQHTVETTERLARLRDLMRKPEISVHAVVVPSEDQHSSEYLAQCDERRAFISGFNGSAGCAIVTLDKAFLFTDGRYFLQAEKQLDHNWTLMKEGLPDVPTWQEFLHKNLEPKTKIGIDPTLISASDAESLTKHLTPKQSSLISLPYNLIDAVWGADRPARPKNRVFNLDEKYSGESHTSKVARIRTELEKKKLSAVVVSMLDEVAWLFNLRGSDIEYNPVFFSYAIITPTKVLLFIASDQLEERARGYLASANVSPSASASSATVQGEVNTELKTEAKIEKTEIEVRPYNSFFDYLKTLPDALGFKHGEGEPKILISNKASFAIAQALSVPPGPTSTSLPSPPSSPTSLPQPPTAPTLPYSILPSPLTSLKSIKNATELQGFRDCHVRDGVALARYFAWLEEKLGKGGEDINEWEAAEVLEGYRRELDLFQGLSFNTISSTGPNGAIIHYSPDPNDCAIIKKDQIYLCDSGGQYLDGTTDVTRTWHFGTPTSEEKRAFTRVLQGNIAIDTAVFPVGTTGYIIDSFARRALWTDGMDYRHGTGHGVGHFLNVHEGPQGIGTRIAYNTTPLKAGMTISNEPGYYKDGAYGMRIENVVLVREATKTRENFGGKGYLEVENVTMCPIHKKLIDTTLLSPDEKAWVDRYHKEVWEKVCPLLEGTKDGRAVEWLRRECAPLEG